MKHIVHKIIPVILVILSIYLLFSEYHREQVGLFTTIKYFGASGIIGPIGHELWTGDKIVGQFVSPDNNLGTIAVRFDTFWRINDDWLVFRLKNVEEKDWYYQNTYKVDQFQNDKMFPFGFPEINNSEGKKYIFEIQSVQGGQSNSVAVSSKYPVYQARFRFPKETILNFQDIGNTTFEKIIKYHIWTVLDYLSQKLAVNFSDFSKASITITYFTPVIFYLLGIRKKIILLVLVLVFFTTLDAVIVTELYDISTLLLVSGWVWYLTQAKPKSLQLSISGFSLLLLMIITYYLPIGEIISQKLGSWTLIFFVFVFFVRVFEVKKTNFLGR